MTISETDLSQDRNSRPGGADAAPIDRVAINTPLDGDGASLSQAIVGRLDHRRRLVDTVSFLAARGVGAERIHVLRGPDGEAFLANVGNRFTRWFADDHSQYVDLLRNGSTLVAVLDVERDDLDHTAALLRHAGVRVLRRYGMWTYTDG